MNRYFAMTPQGQTGPFTPNQLAAAGVGPDTYVWCKGMAGWEKAGEIEEICAYFRTRFQAARTSATRENSVSRQPVLSGSHMGTINLAKPATPPADQEPPEPKAPAPTLFISILLTLFCFPVTGVVAIYYSYKARRAWEEVRRSVNVREGELYSSDERRRLWARLAEYDRQSRMWVGITFFLGFLLYGLLGRKLM